MTLFLTTSGWEAEFGSRLAALRLRENISQKDLAVRAGISLGALIHLEKGQGATIRTLIRVLKALDRLDIIDFIAPEPSIDPLELSKLGKTRERASKRSRT